jgi:hypothetical protein
VIGGLVATAFDAGDGDARKPTGTETRVRIQPHKDSVACSGEKQAVDIYLDDLEARPHPRQEGVNRGVAGFQLTLRYDPSVLRVEKPVDAQLNPTLASAQTAAGMRAWVPAPVTIDNLEGYLVLGALGIPEGQPFDSSAQGLDPVATGEPILLFSVNFQTVGEGTSPLAVYSREEAAAKLGVAEDKFMDYGGREYLPLVIETASMMVTAGDCAPALGVTARPTQVLPTPFPTATPPVIRPWQDVTPVPALEAGRGDCPQGWNAYSDPDGHFSLCYPPGLQATAGPAVSGDRGAALNIVSYAEDGEGTPINTFLIAAAWSPSRQILVGPDGALGCADVELVTRQETVGPADVVVAGRNATGCHGVGWEVGPTGSFQQGSILADIAVNEDGTATSGFIGISVDYTGPDLDGTLESAQRILETLRISAASPGLPPGGSTPASGVLP